MNVSIFVSRYKDRHYFFDDKLQRAFGLQKVKTQNDLRVLHKAESMERLNKAFNKLADVVGQHEKKSDWAITGGLASGIGGAGAGVSAAINTQIKNAEISARNAQRDRDAYALRNYGENFLQNANFNPKERLTEDEISNIRVNTSVDTQTLFKQIKVSYYFDKRSSSNQNISSFKWNTDHSEHLRRTVIYFESTNHIHVDGYLQVNMYSEQGDLLYVRAIPLPLTGTASDSSIVVFLPNNVVSLTFSPIILWQLTDADDPTSTNAWQISDIKPESERDSFENQWNRAWARHDAAEAESDKEAEKRHFFNNGLPIILAIVFCIALLIFALFYIAS